MAFLTLIRISNICSPVVNIPAKNMLAGCRINRSIIVLIAASGENQNREHDDE
jgi:hypothetical protein